MGHILWWLWLISIHIEHSASESRRVQRRMSAARLPTLYSLNRLEHRHNLTPPHGGKVNGRAGTCLPIRFNELCKRSMHSFTSCDCLAAKYAESTRVWHSRFWGILWKKKKNQGLWEESHWLWNKWKIQLHEMSLWKWVIQRRYLCRVRESFQKDLQDRSQVLLIVPSGTLLRSAGWTHMPLFHRHLLGLRFLCFAAAMELLEQGGPKVLWCHLNVTQQWRTSRQYYTSLANQWDAASHFQLESVSLELGWIGTIKVPGTTA